MEDPSKFFNVIIDRTNQKLNSFQAQIIVLESQLQMANDERDSYKKYVEEMPALHNDIEAHNKLKNDYATLENKLHAMLLAKDEQHKEAVEQLRDDFVIKYKDLEDSILELKGRHRHVLDLQREEIEKKYEHLTVSIKEKDEQLQFALDKNEVQAEKLKILQSNINNSTNFIRDQNETLLQEIKRLKAEMAEMSNK